MPNCFTLTNRGESAKEGPVSLMAIDEELCQYLGVPVHPKDYVAGWYDTIGFAYACGKTMDQVVDTYRQYYEFDPTEEDRKRLVIAKYLRENFTTDAWCERY